MHTRSLGSLNDCEWLYSIDHMKKFMTILEL